MTEPSDWEAKQREVVADLTQRSRAVEEALSRIKIRVPSRNGELGVVVNAQGHILDVRLTPQALRLGTAGLAQALVETIKRAEGEAAKQAAEAAKPLTSDPRIAATLSASRQMRIQADSTRSTTR
ncbi:YbaB/EbfC family nucleoid-associated protein [Nocardia sp. NPDC057440]|uniref:YbaB/EbfC family nucleoid-associated protein n=1 Tax=Nocardia sp. NPDC057440 TaxID=3346134 RepID=UPI0036717345